jgi:hypothetical protein
VDVVDVVDVVCIVHGGLTLLAAASWGLLSAGSTAGCAEAVCRRKRGRWIGLLDSPIGSKTDLLPGFLGWLVALVLEFDEKFARVACWHSMLEFTVLLG